MPRPRTARRLFAVSGLCLGLLTPVAIGQTAPTVDPARNILDLIDERLPKNNRAVPISPALQSVLLADYLTDDERRALRIEHGVWEPADLETPADRARAALVAGAYDDPVFADPGVDPTDTAEAFLFRGELEDALRVLAGVGDGIRAARIRAQALYDLARFDDADAAVQPVVDRLLSEQIDDAGELAEGVRSLMIRARIRGSARAGGGDFQTLKSIIERGRNELDRLSWRIRLAEAELLSEKHNLQDAAAALNEVLALNPRCAAAIGMLADLSVNGFAFDQAETLLDRLDEIAAPFGGRAGDADGQRAAPNPNAAIIRARMRLRQRDPVGAIETLGPALERWDRHPGLLAWAAAAHAAAFENAASLRYRETLDERSPGTPIGLYTVGRVMAEARQYDEAVGMLGLAADRNPKWSQPFIELGLVLIQAGRDSEAERVLANAMDLDPFNTRASNSLELVRGLAAFETVESDHFVVRFAPGGEGPGGAGDIGYDAFLAREMLPVLESIHARVCADPEVVAGGIGHEPTRKTLIEIMPSHAWFSVRITGMTRIHTMAAATGPVIAMESPREGPGFTVGPFDWPRVLQHEYTHTVTLSKTRNRIPHWFTEAAAVFCEDAPRDESTWQLLARAYETGTLFDLSEINTAFVRPEKPTDRGQAYAQGHWMYQFIAETWGPAAPTALMDRYAAGEREASAFEAELGVDAETFMSDFKAWAAADLRRVGMLVPENTPTIPEMLKADRRDADDPDAIRPDAAFIERWREQYPGHPQLDQLQLSMSLTRAGDDPRLDDDQIVWFTSLSGALPVAEAPHRALARHYLAGGAGEHALAIPHLEFLDAREQNTATYALELATLHAGIGGYNDAIRYAERAARVSPFDADVREFAARVALKAAIDGDAAMFEVAGRHIEALTVIEPGVEKHRVRLERVREIAGQR